MRYNNTFNHLSVRGRIWILTKSSRMVHIPYLVRMVKVFCQGEWDSSSISKCWGELFLNMQLVPMFRIPPPMDSGSNLLSIIRVPYLLEKREEIPGPTPLREMRRDFSPRQTNNTGPRIPRTRRGRIPRRFFFKSKRKYFYALYQEFRDLPLMKRRLIHQITKSDWVL